MIILTNSQDYPEKSKGAVVAIGNFDGLHLGHMALIEEAKTRAGAMNAPTVIYTFTPHPASVIARSCAPRLLQTLEQKMESLHAAGIDICIIEKFTRNFRRSIQGLFPKHYHAKDRSARNDSRV